MIDVYAFDPGSYQTAGAIVTGGPTGPIRYVDARYLSFGGGYWLEDAWIEPPAHDTFESWVAEAAKFEAPVFIEAIRFIHKKAGIEEFIHTARVEGDLRTYARIAGIAPRLLWAETWRKQLCMTGTPSDAQVKIVVEGVIEGLPSTNNHMRDALGLALVGLLRLLKRKLELPARVYAALRAQQAKDDATRARKKADNAEKEKRTPSRVTRAVRASRRKQQWSLA